MKELALKPADIFSIAIQVEKNGNAFYVRALERLGESELKDCFSRLAGMELAHVNTFVELEKLCGDRDGEDGAPEDAAVSYLKAFARGHVFDPAEDAAAALAGLRTPEDILKKAIVAEKDSIALYTGIKAFIAEDQCGREKIERVIADEMNHLAELSEWLERRTEPGGDGERRSNSQYGR
jgi:rubrerythrin